MDEVTNGMPRRVIGLRWFARGVLVIWAAFWMFFNIASGIGELAEEGLGAAAGHFGMAAVAIVFLLVAWYFELFAGILLVAASIFAFNFFNIGRGNPSSVFVFLVFLLPVLASGLMLAYCWWSSRAAQGPTR